MVAYQSQIFSRIATVSLHVCVSVCVLSCVWLFVTPWIASRQAPLSMGFPRQEYWSGLPFPSPWDSPWPKDWTCVSCIVGGFFTTDLPGNPTVRFSSVQFSRSVVSDSLRPHESQYARPPCPSPTPGTYSNSCPSSWWCK